MAYQNFKTPDDTIFNTLVPAPRSLIFEITSDPRGAAILVDGNNTGFITPHPLQFTDSELLSPKRVSVVNGTNNSIETYIISSEVVFNTTDGNTTTTTTGGGSGGFGGSPGGGGGGGGRNTDVMFDGSDDPINPFTNRGDYVNTNAPNEFIK